MSDADLARIADALKGIEHHIKVAVQVFETMSENIAETGRTLYGWLEVASPDDEDEVQLMIGGHTIPVRITKSVNPGEVRIVPRDDS
jgi:hypothetical protein